MSELSTLAQEYRVASQLSETMNRAVIGIKKAALGTELVDESELRRARTTLSDIVGGFLTALEASARSQISTSRRIPGAVTHRLAGSHRGDLTYFLDDLRQLKVRLEGNNQLTDPDLRLLEEMLATVDSETALVFRRLMRK